MKTPCCNYETPLGSPFPVHLNADSEVVQCHNCGAVYTPSEMVTAPAKDPLGFPNELDLRAQLCKWLEEQQITSENIASIRRKCELPYDGNWNAIVRDETAARENKAQGIRILSASEQLAEAKVKNIRASYIIWCLVKQLSDGYVKLENLDPENPGWRLFEFKQPDGGIELEAKGE